MVSYKIIFNMKKTIIFTLFFIFSIKVFAQINGKTSSFDLPIGLSKTKFTLTNTTEITKNLSFGGNYSHGIGKYFLLGANISKNFNTETKDFSTLSSVKKSKSNSFGVSGSVIIPFSEKFIPYIRSEYQYTKYNLNANTSIDKKDFSIGAGLYYFLNQNVAADLNVVFLNENFIQTPGISKYLGVSLSTTSFLQNQGKVEKENPKQLFVNKGRNSLTANIHYFQELKKGQGAFSFNFDYQHLLTNTVGIDVKVNYSKNFRSVNPNFGYYFHAAPNFYICPRIGILAEHYYYPQSSSSNIFYSHLGLNFEYFINKYIAFRVNSTYFEWFPDKRVFKSNIYRTFDISTGLVYYLN
jgi:hypothetical protein